MEECHYGDVIMGSIASQITSLTIVYSIVYFIQTQIKEKSKLRVTGLCAGNSPGPVNCPHKGPVTRKMFPFDDVIMPLDIALGDVAVSHMMPYRKMSRSFEAGFEHRFFRPAILSRGPPFTIMDRLWSHPGGMVGNYMFLKYVMKLLIHSQTSEVAS